MNNRIRCILLALFFTSALIGARKPDGVYRYPIKDELIGEYVHCGYIYILDNKILLRYSYANPDSTPCEVVNKFKSKYIDASEIPYWMTGDLIIFHEPLDKSRISIIDLSDSENLQLIVTKEDQQPRNIKIEWLSCEDETDQSKNNEQAGQP